MIAVVMALMQALPVQHFPQLEHPGSAPALRATADAICGNPAALDRGALLSRENRLELAVRPAAAPAAAWIALGCVRVALDGDGALAHEGPLMDAGNSWATGAERAFLKALDADPDDARAAEALAALALDDLAPDDLSATARALLRAAAAGASTPNLLRACDDLALRVGDTTAARRCATTGLARGSDSTWHLIRLARIAFRAADTAAGSQAFFEAANAAHDTASRSEIDWQLQWFLSPDEEATASRLADGERAGWIRDRLAERDVRDGRPRGARLAEHFNRLEYALANFRLHLSAVNRRGGGLLAPTPINSLSPESVASFCEPGLIPAYPERDYHRWQSEVDDRGVVWLRFGPPEKRIRASPNCSDTIISDPIGGKHLDGTPLTAFIAMNTREVWYYEIDGKPLILSFEAEKFSGSVEATRLVTGVLGSYFCDVDAVRCGLTQSSIADFTARLPHFGMSGSRSAKPAAAPASPLVSPEDIEHVRQDDRGFISAATTSDDNGVRGDRNIAIVARFHRLWDPVSGASIGLVTYALPVKDLSVQTDAAGETAVVELAVRQWDRDAVQWRDTTVSRRFQISDDSRRRTNLVGYLVVPSTSGGSAWSAVATQPDHRLGRAADVSTPGLDHGPLAVSDLVIGASSQGLRWTLHGEPVPLAPVNVVDRRDTASMYYQIRSDAARDGLRTTVAFYRIKDAVVSDSAALQVTFDQAIRPGVNEVAPTLDLSNLGAGSYRLEVRIVDPRGTVLARRNTTLELR